nr:MAG TPA: hypothetical protein [Caudoviricetes sp.]
MSSQTQRSRCKLKLNGQSLTGLAFLRFYTTHYGGTTSCYF